MGIDAKHPLYQANVDAWQRCRTCYEGEDAVKAAGALYLPLVSSAMDGTAYAAYKMRASYFEAVGRTVDGYVGAISRKPHVFELPEKLQPLIGSTTADNVGLAEFVKMMCSELLLVGRGGVLVDYDEATELPFLKLYPAESIINWSPGSVVLAETVYEADPDDKFAQKPISQLRRIHMDDGHCAVTVWRKSTSAVSVGSEWAIYSEATPTYRGRAFDALPWVWLNLLGNVTSIEKPPLLGIANLSLSHYRTSADLEHGRHYTGLPTLYVAGVSERDATIDVGASAAILLNDPQAKVGYAEFSGQGLGSLENALEQKERQMAALGAAALNVHRKGIEAAETARIRVSGEHSLLMTVVSAVEAVLTAALQIAADWCGATGKIHIELNRDFVDVTLAPQTLTALLASYQAGAISLETFLYCLQQGEFLQPDVQVKDEAEKLAAAAGAKAKSAEEILQI